MYDTSCGRICMSKFEILINFLKQIWTRYKFDDIKLMQQSYFVLFNSINKLKRFYSLVTWNMVDALKSTKKIEWDNKSQPLLQIFLHTQMFWNFDKMWKISHTFLCLFILFFNRCIHCFLPVGLTADAVLKRHFRAGRHISYVPDDLTVFRIFIVEKSVTKTHTVYRMINQTPGSLIVNGRLWVKCELDSSMKISFVFTEKKRRNHLIL